MFNHMNSTDSITKFKEWYEQFQSLIRIWKESFSNLTWLESHEQELLRLGIDPSKLIGNMEKDIASLASQIMYNQQNARNNNVKNR